MEKIVLTLRQRKILYYLMNHRTTVTGAQLARELDVTDRTIRSDILQINEVIRPYQAEIVPERSKGYCFQAENDEKIHELNRIELGLLTKEERMRYLAFVLCMADQPIHFLDLEEEMFVSRTTLEQDVKLLQQRFVFGTPFIRLFQKNNTLFFEQNEKKIREILTRLIHNDWSYHKRQNAYYRYQFPDEKNLDYIMDLVPVCLHHNGIFLEDPALVYLDVMLAIACQRVQDGHVLPDSPLLPEIDPEVKNACREIFLDLEAYFGRTFPESEKETVCMQIFSTRLPDMMTDFENKMAVRDLDPAMRRIAERYLEKINATFGIDLRGDDDFYITLCLTISTFQNESYIYNTQGNWAFAKERMQDEMELAVLFQEFAMKSFGRFLSEIELISLAHCIGGAFVYLFQTHPEFKLRTVLCTHRNMASVWHLKRVLLSQYNTYLDITGLIPVNSHSSYDFSSTDLVLTTVPRKITDHPGTETLTVSYFMTEQDAAGISGYISRKRSERLFPVSQERISQTLKDVHWHEKETMKSIRDLIAALCRDYREDKGLYPALQEDILQREATLSFVTGPGIVFLSSVLPAEKTGLSVMTLEHRISWNNQRIRIIVLGVFRREELPLLFYLKHLFLDGDREALRGLKTKEEIRNHFRFE